MPKKSLETKTFEKVIDLEQKRQYSYRNAKFLYQDSENSLVFEMILFIGVLMITCGQNYTLYHMPYTRSFINNHPMFPSYAEYLAKNNITKKASLVSTYLNLPGELLNTFYFMLAILLVPFVKVLKRYYSIKLTFENIIEYSKTKASWSKDFKFSVALFIIHFGVVFPLMLYAGGIVFLETNGFTQLVIFLPVFAMELTYSLLNLFRERFVKNNTSKTWPLEDTYFHSSTWYTLSVHRILSLDELNSASGVRAKSQLYFNQLKYDILEILLKTTFLTWVSTVLPIVLHADIEQADQTWSKLFATLTFLSILIAYLIHYFPAKRLTDLIAIGTALGHWDRIGIKISETDFIEIESSIRKTDVGLVKWDRNKGYKKNQLVWLGSPRGTEYVYQAFGQSTLNAGKPTDSFYYWFYQFFGSKPTFTVKILMITQILLVLFKVALYHQNDVMYRLVSLLLSQCFEHYCLFKLVRLYVFLNKIIKVPDLLYQGLLTQDIALSKKNQ